MAGRWSGRCQIQAGSSLIESKMGGGVKNKGKSWYGSVAVTGRGAWNQICPAKILGDRVPEARPGEGVKKEEGHKERRQMDFEVLAGSCPPRGLGYEPDKAGAI